MSGLLLAITVVRYFKENTGPVDATVRIDRTLSDSTASTRGAEVVSNLPAEGEVYRTADRLRETASVAYAAALFVVNQQIRGTRLGSARVLIASLANQSLLPPGVTWTPTPDALESARAMIYLRYRPDPFGIEVISIGKSRLDGPALMLRVPGEGELADRSIAFIAMRLDQTEAPPAFALSRAWIDAGWIEHSLRSPDTSEQEIRDLFNWMASVSNARKER